LSPNVAKTTKLNIPHNLCTHKFFTKFVILLVSWHTLLFKKCFKAFERVSPLVFGRGSIGIVAHGFGYELCKLVHYTGRTKRDAQNCTMDRFAPARPPDKTK